MKDNEQSRQTDRLQSHWCAQKNKRPQNLKAFRRAHDSYRGLGSWSDLRGLVQTPFSMVVWLPAKSGDSLMVFRVSELGVSFWFNLLLSLPKIVEHPCYVCSSHKSLHVTSKNQQGTACNFRCPHSSAATKFMAWQIYPWVGTSHWLPVGWLRESLVMGVKKLFYSPGIQATWDLTG